MTYSRQSAKKRRVLPIVMAMLLACLLGIGGTLAMLTDKRDTKNTIAFGSITVQMVTTPHSGKVVPDNGYAHKVKVQNMADSMECYLRATVTITGVGNGQTDIDEFIALNSLGAKWRTAPGETWNDGATVTVYYTEKLAPGDVTDDLLTGFYLYKNRGNVSMAEEFLEAANNSFQIIVDVEAVQTRAGDVEYPTPEAAFSAFDTL